MTSKEAIAQLQTMRNEQMVKLHKKNGAGDNLIGVKLGDIRTLANKIKSDHAMGLELWQTGIIDARLLAMLIIKPKHLSVKELDTMVKQIDLPQIADWFSAYVLKEHPEKDALREPWVNDSNIWAARAGWSLTAGKATREPASLDLDKLLDRIEKEMPAAAPEVQWTMNTTLAQIGINSPDHRERALRIGETLGIYRDYPVAKGCTSPFAPIWINEMVKRKQ